MISIVKSRIERTKQKILAAEIAATTSNNSSSSNTVNEEKAGPTPPPGITIEDWISDTRTKVGKISKQF